MQRSLRATQRLYLVMLSMSSHPSHPVDTPAQRVIVPIGRREFPIAHQ